ncbi:hypothetical protein NE237_017904 [Protea cynaroides]|uniref:Uncharacterized protein n=1 Tax=Protea cynaroides TaxID=273540 RepID=A0A9Q0QNF1_9MAGN|nr:hypothetical protein NE237_017904 [Protea cynaroides]
MFSIFLKRLVPIGRTVRDSTVQPSFQQNLSCLQSISAKPSQDLNPFVVSYLINRCGLSPAAATSASKRVNFETSDRPDSVLTLFRNHGFTETQISDLIKKQPSLIVADPAKTLLPKLKFFHSSGISCRELAKILSRDPVILHSSLDKKIIPAFNFFKGLVGTVENVVIALKYQTRFLKCDLEHLARNVAILRENRVSESDIVMLLTKYPRSIIPGSDRFNEIVEEAKKMGFNPATTFFVVAIHALASMSKSTWKQKLEVYQRWGLCENEIFSAFRLYPWFMTLSETKIVSQMDFFVKRMGLELADIMKDPLILGFSLEKRIIPRCSVLRVLMLKGLVKKDLKIGYLLKRSEKQFLERFVTMYVKEVPQLLDVYKGKTSLLELGYRYEEGRRPGPSLSDPNEIRPVVDDGGTRAYDDHYHRKENVVIDEDQHVGSKGGTVEPQTLEKVVEPAAVMPQPSKKSKVSQSQTAAPAEAKRGGRAARNDGHALLLGSAAKAEDKTVEYGLQKALEKYTELVRCCMSDLLLEDVDIMAWL